MRHHIYTPRSHGDHTYHHYHDTSLPVAQDSPALQTPQRVPAVASMSEVHHHHYGNTAPTTNQPAPRADVSMPSHMIHHRHYDNVVPQTPVDGLATTTVNQVHRHHHYGNGDFTMQLKKQKNSKKEYCNISEHEDLVRSQKIYHRNLSSVIFA